MLNLLNTILAVIAMVAAAVFGVGEPAETEQASQPPVEQTDTSE